MLPKLRTSCVCGCVVVMLAAPSVTAPTSAQGNAVDRCDAVLTAAEVTEVVGTAYEGPAFREMRPGVSQCDWQGEDTNFGFSFSTVAALKADERTADQEYEQDIAAVEGTGAKRQPMPGVEGKVALVPLADDAVLVEVQRPDGVVRLTAYKVAPDKLQGLVRAIVKP